MSDSQQTRIEVNPEDTSLITLSLLSEIVVELKVLSAQVQGLLAAAPSSTAAGDVRPAAAAAATHQARIDAASEVDASIRDMRDQLSLMRQASQS